MKAAFLRRAARRDDADRDEQLGNRQHDVGEARESCIRPAAVVAREQADDRPDGHGDSRGDDADEERGAGAVHRPHEEISPRTIRTEPELRVRTLGNPEVVGHRVVGLVLRVPADPLGDLAAEEGQEDQQDDHYAPGQSSLVLLEPHPEELPWALSYDSDARLENRVGSAHAGTGGPCFALGTKRV